MGFFGKLLKGASGLANKASGFIGKVHAKKEDLKKKYEEKAPSWFKGVVETLMNTTPLGDLASTAEGLLDAAHAKSGEISGKLKDIHTKHGTPPHEVANKIMATPMKEEAPPPRMEQLASA